ncbi:MAG TPA: cation ABC transporter substrate-binding protein [Desulfobacteraceae bacterium]|nr:zinc ABC transporter substrate-binding protein [Deltaproteobacteria bacterium]HDI59818.1 cation ABC transporter substrate-binding protein [Desulfobacteraceae bacterium]
MGRWCWFVLLCGLFPGAVAGAGATDEPLLVYVSILPQRDFVQRIAGDRVAVEVMVRPGASPATYEPKAQQMAGLSRARIYFAVGVPFEAVWLPRIVAANPAMRLVHTDAGIPKRTMAAHYHGAEAGRDADHDNRSHDPHVWLSPPLVKIQARAILEALVAVDPDHRERYETNWRNFVARLDALDQRLRQSFARRRGMCFMVFHPAWGYFAEAYGLRQVPIELEGKEPKPAQLRELVEIARCHDIRVIFVQPQFSRRSAELVAREIGARVVDADPLPADWFANMNEVAAKFEAALK